LLAAVSAVLVTGLCVAFLPASAAVSPGATQIVSLAVDGTQKGGDSRDPAISATGRYIAFASEAPLDPEVLISASGGTPTQWANIYVRDTVTNQTMLVSTATGNGTAVDTDFFNAEPSISADGRYIAFTTYATNVPTAGSGSFNIPRIVICDRDKDGDGVFSTCQFTQVRGTPTEGYLNPVLSADATRLAFLETSPDARLNTHSYAKYVALPHGTNGTLPADIQDDTIVDLHAHMAPLTITPTGGNEFPETDEERLAMSADGSTVAVVAEYIEFNDGVFVSSLTAILVLRVQTPQSPSVRADIGPVPWDPKAVDGPIGDPSHFVGDVSLSGNGGLVGFDVGNSIAGGPVEVAYVVNLDPDGNGVPSLNAPRAAVVSLDNAGSPVTGIEPTFSRDGRYVAFASDGVGVHNGVDDPIRFSSCLQGGELEAYHTEGGQPGRAPALAISDSPSPSPSAPEVTGISYCDVVVRDLTVDTARAKANQPRLPGELASPSVRGDCLAFVAGSTCEGDGDSSEPVLDADGSAVAYASQADDQVATDTNNSEDVFERRFTPTITLAGVNFNKVQVGQSTTLAVPVVYHGFGPLAVGAVTITGADASDFTVFPSQDCTGTVLHETGQCLVSVRFKPGAVGNRSAVLNIASATGAATGVLRGEGVPEPPPLVPGFTATPNPLDFGTHPVATPTGSLAVDVANPGTGPLTVTGVSIVGTAPTGFAGDYAITADTCTGKPVAPGAHCQVSVRFSAQATGNRPALLQFTDNAATLPQVVSMTGAGAVPTIAVKPPLAPPGAVSQVSGTAFPPGRQVVVTLDRMPGQVTATVAADGTFTVPLVIFPHTEPGQRQVHATVQGVPGPLVASANYLVVPGSLQPPDFAGRN
jgi:dipeptidyl aminopeptidase/acylaminoacyl peptidase